MRKLTQAEFLERAIAVHGAGRYDYSLSVYAGSGVKIKMICSAHGQFEQLAYSHLAGRGCDQCGGTAKLDTASFIAKAKDVHGNKYDYSQAEYTKSDNKLTIICPVHGVFKQAAGGHLQGGACPPCSGRTMHTTASFITRAREVHGDTYDYSQVVFTKAENKVLISCTAHGVFAQVAIQHLSGRGCRQCGLASAAQSHEYDTLAFITRAKELHGERYNYSQVDYVDSKSKVLIGCPEHGLFKQPPATHLQGAGCRKCAGTALLSASEFISKARKVHGEKYDYSQAVYVNTASKVVVVCPVHGAYKTKPNTHLSGHGCMHCAGNAKGSLETFIARAREVHGEKYDYSRSVYKGVNAKLLIACPTHGEFWQPPKQHVKGQGCIRCGFESGVIKRAPINRLLWIDQAAGRLCSLYFLHMYNDRESFYKVGITSTTTKKRYGSKTSLGGYSHEVLLVHKSLNAAAVWDWEQSILESFKHLAYIPKSYFPGHLECFSNCDEILAIFPL